jgi:hypothetical protein
MMKLQNVPVGDIVKNPWRDKDLYPISDDRIAGLRESIRTHGFFTTPKGRRRNGKVEIGCGHARLAAAKKAGLATIPIFIDDIDDDAMLLLMTDENALQSGANPGAVMNEVAAVTRRLIEGLLRGGTIVPPVAKAFESNLAIEAARGKLRRGTDVHIALGHGIIRRYLGQGDIDESHRAERQVREAITALKQSGKYDDIVDEALRRYPPVVSAAPSTSTAVARRAPARRVPRERILDERCASVFPNDHQFHAFREAVTTRTARRFIPIERQLDLARQIMARPAGNQGRGGANTRRQIGAPHIQRMVQAEVEEASRRQRDIDQEEREAFLREQREERITRELHSANASLRSLVSSLAKLDQLADEFPDHPKIGGFSARLDLLTNSIKQLSRKLRRAE